MELGEKTISAKADSPKTIAPHPAPPLAAEIAHEILAAAPLLLYVYDVQNERISFQNRCVGELLGYPPGEQQQSEWRQFLHGDDAVHFTQHHSRLKTIVPGETLHWEFRMRAANGAWRWFTSRDVLMSSDGDGKPLLIVGSAVDATERKHAEELKDLLAGEMRHRAKNLVAVVEAIGRQSRPKNEPAATAFIETFMGRLLTLLNTGDIVLATAARTGDLGDVLKLALGPFMHEDAPQSIALNGPPVALSEHTVGGLALAAHELATNAVKYGALSVADGTVCVNWSVTPKGDANRIVLEWIESGGPPVRVPESVGFGTRVVKQSVAHEPNARVTFDYKPEGLRCLFEFESARS